MPGATCTDEVVTVLLGKLLRTTWTEIVPLLSVLSGPRPNDRRMVDILWGDRTLVVFTEDLERRGEEVRIARGTVK